MQGSIKIDIKIAQFLYINESKKEINENKKKIELRVSLHGYSVYYLNPIKIPASTKDRTIVLISGKNYVCVGLSCQTRTF